MRDYRIVSSHSEENGWECLPLKTDTVAVLASFDIGFRSYSEEAVQAVERGEIPTVLRGNDQLGRARVQIEGGSVCVRGDHGYSGPVAVRVGNELDELIDWLDRYFSARETEPKQLHWRERRGAYGFRAVEFIEFSAAQIEAMRKREKAFLDANAAALRDAPLEGHAPLIL